MESQYGPSTIRIPIRKQKRIRELFGTDSECEETETNSRKVDPNAIRKLEEQLQQELCDLTDSEGDDVLEITIDNDYFNTPNKLSHLTQESSSVLPLDKSSRQTHTFETPSKQTTSIAESLTPTVKHIFKQTIHPVEVLSPLHNTPIRNVHLHQEIPVVSITQAHAHTPQTHTQAITSLQRTLASHAGAFKEQVRTNTLVSLTHGQKVNEQQTHSSSKSQLQKRFAHAYKSKQTSHTSTRFQPYSRIQHSRTFKNQLAHTLTSNTQTFARTQTTNSRSHNLASITRTLTQIQPSHSRSHTITSATVTHTIAQFKHPHNHNTSNALVSNIGQSFQGQSTSIHTGQPNTHTERQTAVTEPKLSNRTSKSAPNTKTIKLNNKYVPNGVQLAISVDRNKKLSKNALKKITRNLLSQM